MDEQTNARLAALEQRVMQLEDERAILDLITRYGLAVDSGDVDATAALYALDCLIDIDGVNVMTGREEARQTVLSPTHQALLPNCAHVMGPFSVRVDEDRAVATGYATVFLKVDGVSRVWRQSFGRWELERREGRWQVTRRTSLGIGRDDGAALVTPALARLD